MLSRCMLHCNITLFRITWKHLQHDIRTCKARNITIIYNIMSKIEQTSNAQNKTFCFDFKVLCIRSLFYYL